MLVWFLIVVGLSVWLGLGLITLAICRAASAGDDAMLGEESVPRRSSPSLSVPESPRAAG